MILESDKGVYFVKLFLINRDAVAGFKTTCKATHELSFFLDKFFLLLYDEHLKRKFYSFRDDLTVSR